MVHFMHLPDEIFLRLNGFLSMGVLSSVCGTLFRLLRYRHVRLRLPLPRDVDPDEAMGGLQWERAINLSVWGQSRWGSGRRAVRALIRCLPRMLRLRTLRLELGNLLLGNIEIFPVGLAMPRLRNVRVAMPRNVMGLTGLSGVLRVVHMGFVEILWVDASSNRMTTLDFLFESYI